MSSSGALSGITVLDLSRLLPGPFCSMVLADHGARVIAIEDRRFEAEAGLSAPVYRNKSHINLNLKSEQGRSIFFKMAETADVVLEGFRPGVVERLGIDYDTVAEKNPGVIYCSITGYGQTGPYSGFVGHDVNYLSIAGVLDLIGQKEGAPSIPGIQIADMAGGGLYGAIGILMALYARSSTGRGQYVDISMTDGSFSLLSMASYMEKLIGIPARRSDSLLSHRYACYNVYETADNRYLSIGAVERRFWDRLCDFFNVPEYGPLQYDDERREEIKDFMRKKFREKTLAEWESELAGLEICWAPVLTVEESMELDLFEKREMVSSIEFPDGKTRETIGTPVKLSMTPGGIKTPPPGFGWDTKAVLREYGYSEQQISDFESQGVI